MGTFIIEGGHKLHGEITPQGAKNEALQILCAALLTAEEVVINNIPDIVDVNKLIALLKDLGVKVNKLGKGSYSFKADEVDIDYLQSDNYKRDGGGLRGSIMCWTLISQIRPRLYTQTRRRQNWKKKTRYSLPRVYQSRGKFQI